MIWQTSAQEQSDIVNLYILIWHDRLDCFFQVPLSKHIHSSYCLPTLSHYWTHSVIAYPIKQKLFLYKLRRIVQWIKLSHCGYFKATTWPPSGEVMHGRSWDCIIFHPLQKPCLLTRFRVFKSGVFWGGCTFLWKPGALSQSWIWITVRIFLQIKGVHLNLRESSGDSRRAPLLVNLSLSDRRVPSVEDCFAVGKE